MEGKQDVLLSQCPEGFAFREIQPDGSVTCQSMEITEENGDVTMTRTRILSTTILNKAIRTCKTFFVTCLDWSPWGYDSSRVKATCPAGYMATGSSHAVYEPSSTGYTGGQEPDIINVLINTWPSAFTESVVVSAKSFSTTTDYEIIAIVNCLKVE